MGGRIAVNVRTSLGLTQIVTRTNCMTGPIIPSRPPIQSNLLPPTGRARSLLLRPRLSVNVAIRYIHTVTPRQNNTLPGTFTLVI